MPAKEVLIDQFEACYDHNTWFVSLKTVLDGVTEENADWQPEGVNNNIRENVDHIIFWNERWLQRYRGELNKPENVENETTFHSSIESWPATLEKLWAVMDEWRDKLGSIDDAKLAEQVNAEYHEPWEIPLAHQNVHNAYHIGQILLLRKLQGSWNPEKGVS